MIVPVLDLDIDIALPDHTQLPDKDGIPVVNFQELPQDILLSDSIMPVLRQLHPDGQFCIGHDSGIYWRLIRPPEDPLRGVIAPDWYYVEGVSPLAPDGRPRRSYVIWQEHLPPVIVIEFVSGDGSEEHDATPWQGKFWIYEQILRVPFYAIIDSERDLLEVYHLIEGRYTLMEPNTRGHFPIPPMGVELGKVKYSYMGMDLPWLSWWDNEGALLLTGEERSEQDRQRAEQERQRAEQERQRAEQERQRAEQERQRAEQERQRADAAEQRAQHLVERLRAMGSEPED